MIESAMATKEELDELEEIAKKKVKEIQKEAWNEFLDSIKQEQADVVRMINNMANGDSGLVKIAAQLASMPDALRKELVSAARKAIRNSLIKPTADRNVLIKWYEDKVGGYAELYNSK